jgi:hypothetical protein
MRSGVRRRGGRLSQAIQNRNADHADRLDGRVVAKATRNDIRPRERRTLAFRYNACPISCASPVTLMHGDNNSRRAK